MDAAPGGADQKTMERTTEMTTLSETLSYGQMLLNIGTFALIALPPIAAFGYVAPRLAALISKAASPILAAMRDGHERQVDRAERFDTAGHPRFLMRSPQYADRLSRGIDGLYSLPICRAISGAKP